METVAAHARALAVGCLEIEPRAYRVTVRGEPVAFSASQVEILAALVSNADRVLTRAELATAAGLDHTASVDVILSSLRRVLGEGFVRNVRNRGWIIEPGAFES